MDLGKAGSPSPPVSRPQSRRSFSSVRSPAVRDLVVDAGALLAWLFGEEQAKAVETRIGDTALVAPSLWRLEVVNAVLIKERPQGHHPGPGHEVSADSRSDGH